MSVRFARPGEAIVIGASSGGVAALTRRLPALPADTRERLRHAAYARSGAEHISVDHVLTLDEIMTLFQSLTHAGRT